MTGPQAPCPEMTHRQAFEINDRVASAWMVQKGFSSAPLPDLSGVSLQEALRAAEIVRTSPPRPAEGGGSIITCAVAAEDIPSLYAWARARGELDRICHEHAAARQASGKA